MVISTNSSFHGGGLKAKKREKKNILMKEEKLTSEIGNRFKAFKGVNHAKGILYIDKKTLKQYFQKVAAN
jgi:hypothetical protein